MENAISETYTGGVSWTQIPQDQILPRKLHKWMASQQIDEILFGKKTQLRLIQWNLTRNSWGKQSIPYYHTSAKKNHNQESCVQALIFLKHHLHFRSIFLWSLLHLICRKRFIRVLSIWQETNFSMPTDQGIQSKSTSCRTTQEKTINKSRSSILASFILLIQMLTLSIIISSKNHKNVLEERHQCQSPEDKRKGTKNLFIGL